MRYASPFKKEAMALLKKYKPSDGRARRRKSPGSPTKTLMGQADEAIASHEWDRAIALLDGGRPQSRPREKSRQGQHWHDTTLAFCYYMNKAVLRSGRARRALRPPLSAGGAWRARRPRSACSRWPMLITTYTEIDRRSDIMTV